MFIRLPKREREKMKITAHDGIPSFVKEMVTRRKKRKTARRGIRRMRSRKKKVPKSITVLD